MSRPAGVPRSATPGRRSIGAAARRISTRPRILPGLAAAAPPGAKDTKARKATQANAARTNIAPPVRVLCSLRCALVMSSSLKPVDQLPGEHVRRLQQTATVAVVVLE